MANTLNLGTDGNWATKEGSVLGYNSENNNYKPLAFSFSRASSGTVINKAGLIETVGSGEPRIDFKDNTKGALLLEPTRSNVITNSNDLTIWNGAGMTRTFVDDLINPSNVLGASKLTQTSSGGYAWLSRTFTGNETFSAFVKKDSSNFARLYAANNTVYFDIVNGTVETEVGSDITDKSIIDYGNGWFRISMSVNSTAASYVRIYPASSGSSSSDTNSLFVYGTQLEQGSYATSYIPTSGSAVTRVADVCNQTPPDGVIGQTEGTVYCEIKLPNQLATIGRTIFQIGTGNNRIYIAKESSTQNIFQMATQSSSGYNFINTSEITTENIKFAIGYKNGDNAFYLNGNLISSASSNTNPTVLNEFFLGQLGSLTKIQVNIKETKLYNTRLSNNELQALTRV